MTDPISKDAEIALLKADFQNASDAADAYCVEIAALTKQRDMWKASYDKTCELFHAKCAEIAALKAERNRGIACEARLNAVAEALTEQRDRAMAEVATLKDELNALRSR